MQPVSTSLNRFSIASMLAAVLLGTAVVHRNVIAVVAAIVLALTTLLPVEVALGAFAFLVPFDYVLAIGRYESAIRVTWLAGAFAGGVLLVYGLISGRVKRPPAIAWWWVLFAFWVGLSTFWAIDPVASINRLPSVVTLTCLYLITVSFVLTQRELSRVLTLVVIGGAVAALVLISQTSAGVHAAAGHYMSEGRGALEIGGWEGNPNEFGASLVLPFSLALAGVLSRGTLAKKIVLLLAVTLIAAAVFLTMSRGALVALTVAVLVLLSRVGLRKRALLLVVLIAVPLLFLPDLFFQRLVDAPSGRGTGRLDILFVGLQIIKHNPLLGVGMSSFPTAYDRYAGYAPIFHGYHWSSHNAYLQAWAETGIIGFVLLVVAITFQMKTARAALRHARPADWSGVAVEAACWGILVYAFSGDVEFNKSFWLILMLLTLVAQCRRAVPIYDP